MSKMYGDSGYFCNIMRNGFDKNIPFSKYLKLSHKDLISGYSRITLPNDIQVFTESKDNKDNKEVVIVYYWDGLGNFNENNFIETIYNNLVPDNTKFKIVLTKVKGENHDNIMIPVLIEQ